MLGTANCLSSLPTGLVPSGFSSSRISLALFPTAAARFLTGAIAQSARYLIEHREDAVQEDLETDMKILITKLFE